MMEGYLVHFHPDFFKPNKQAGYSHMHTMEEYYGVELPDFCTEHGIILQNVLTNSESNTAEL